MTLLRLIAISALLTTVLFAASKGETTKDETPEPPFPSIFKRSFFDTNTIKIVSEAIGDDVGYQTTEEYVDLSACKAALLTNNHAKGREVLFSDAKTATTCKYRPYKCDKFKLDEKIYEDLNEYLFHCDTSSQARRDVPSDRSGRSDLRLFGVAGWWMLAENKPKQYSKADLIFSTSKDIYRPSHNWEFKENGRLIGFHFMEVDTNPKKGQSSVKEDAPVELSLEMIQIKSLDSKTILRTINVMTMDNWIDNEERDRYLELPVGYGCLASQEEMATGDYLDGGMSWYKFQLEHGRTELEVTETRLISNPKGEEKTTKTVNIELAHTKLKNHDLTLTRIKNNNEDTRTIYWNEFKTKFRVDMRRGTCEMSHFNERDQNGLTVDEDRLIKFSKESGLSLDARMLKLLFEDTDGFMFVKQTESTAKDMSHLYLEKELESWPYNLDGSRSGETKGGQVARVMRNFVASSNLEVLESVTVWLFDKSQTQIIRSYQLNLIDYKEVDAFFDAASLFDVSEECYLYNQKYRSGKQYAWFELFYPTTSRLGDLISQDEPRFKQMVYKQLLSAPDLQLSSFRMPRMEFMFDDEGLIVRCLVLDRPPVELIYDQVENKRVVLDEKAGDSTHVEANVEHCAKVCQLQSCKAMTYCQYDRQCYIRLGRTSEADLSTAGGSGCMSYLLPRMVNDDDDFDNGNQQNNYDEDKLVRKLHDSSLQQILSRLQHQDYGVVPVPKAPDELLMERAESGLDDEAYQALTQDYTKELNRFLEEDAHMAPQLTLIIMTESHVFVLLPSRFTLEDDPLDQFDLVDREAEDTLEMGNKDGRGSYFDDGIPFYRYKMTAFLKDTQWRAKQFDGLTYDQCALACLDSRCGSFSYCENTNQCTLTSVNNTKTAHQAQLIEPCVECSISFRDFLANFKLFDNIYAPQVYRRQSQEMLKPSDCALECISTKDFKCLSFQFCKGSKSCFYQEVRHPSGIFDAGSMSAKGQDKSTGLSPKATGCDHYERSLLADFNQIEYRQIDPTQMAELSTTMFEHKSIFECAEICVNELTDCSAFQFCFLHKAGDNQLRPQQCQMIQSKPNGDKRQFAITMDDGDRVLEAGKFIVTSEQCHLFALRKDTSEAQLRELALPDAINLDEKRDLEAKLAASKSGLSLLGGLYLFLAVGLISTALGFTFGLAYERDHFDIRQRIERVRLLLGV